MSSQPSSDAGQPATILPQGEHPTTAPERYGAVTIRAVLLGLFGAVWITSLQLASKVWPQTVVLPLQSALTLLSGPVFWLFVLAVVNALLRRRLPGVALRPSEFAVIYGITHRGAGHRRAGRGDAAVADVRLPVPRHTGRRPWDRFRQFIPAWLVPQDPAVVEPYYLGGGTFWRPGCWPPGPCRSSAWMLWLRRLGRDDVGMERDPAPPLDGPRPARLSRACSSRWRCAGRAGFGGLVSGRLFWGGVLVSTLLESLEQVHARFPAVPSVPLGFAASPVLEAARPPLERARADVPGVEHAPRRHLLLHPARYPVQRLVLLPVPQGDGGLRFRHGLARPGMGCARVSRYTRMQAAGAWIGALLPAGLGGAPPPAARAGLGVLPRGRPMDDSQRAGLLPPGRAASCCSARCSCSSGASLSGMSLGLALVFYAFFWMLNVTMTRVYAQVGPPILELYFLDPQKTLTTVFGTYGQSPRSLTLFSLMYWINRTDRGHPMAHQLSAFRIGEATRTDPRALGKWVLVAFVVGCADLPAGPPALAYRVGEDQFVEGGWREAFCAAGGRAHQPWVNDPEGPQWTEIGFMAPGAAITLVARQGQLHLHRLSVPSRSAIALAMCFTVEYNWPAFLGIWIFKGLLLRYAGRGLYQRLIPFFLGLTLGGLVAPVCLGAVSFLLGWYR